MTVRHRSASVDEFIENHSHDISRGGMFINTTTPFPPGTLLKFEVRIAGERRVLQGVGRVLWKRETAGAGDQQPAGMGIKFIKIDPETRDIIDRLVSSRPDTKAAFEAGAQTAGIELEPAAAANPVAPKSSGWPKPRPTQIGLGAVRLDQTPPPSSTAAPSFPEVPPALPVPAPAPTNENQPTNPTNPPISEAAPTPVTSVSAQTPSAPPARARIVELAQAALRDAADLHKAEAAHASAASEHTEDHPKSQSTSSAPHTAIHDSPVAAPKPLDPSAQATFGSATPEPDSTPANPIPNEVVATETPSAAEPPEPTPKPLTANEELTARAPSVSMNETRDERSVAAIVKPPIDEFAASHIDPSAAPYGKPKAAPALPSRSDGGSALFWWGIGLSAAAVIGLTLYLLPGPSDNTTTPGSAPTFGASPVQQVPPAQPTPAPSATASALGATSAGAAPSPATPPTAATAAPEATVPAPSTTATASAPVASATAEAPQATVPVPDVSEKPSPKAATKPPPVVKAAPHKPKPVAAAPEEPTTPAPDTTAAEKPAAPKPSATPSASAAPPKLAPFPSDDNPY